MVRFSNKFLFQRKIFVLLEHGPTSHFLYKEAAPSFALSALAFSLTFSQM